LDVAQLGQADRHEHRQHHGRHDEPEDGTGLAHGNSQHGYERCREAARGYREPGLHDVDPPRNGAHVRPALRRHTLLRYATARTFLRHQPDRPTLPYPAAAATPATATASWTTPGRRRRRLSRYLRRRSPPS